MKIFRAFSSFLGLILTACIGNMNPNGSAPPNYPYFIVSEPVMVKKILVPKGTKLTYKKSFRKEGIQENMMNENDLTAIEFPADHPVNWGGVPITSINKFFNSEMRGYTVTAKFDLLSEDKKTKFSQIWQNCSSDLGITIKNEDDWSFNIDNIADVENCSVIYQRYFKNDKNQQEFLDNMLAELRKVDVK